MFILVFYVFLSGNFVVSGMKRKKNKIKFKNGCNCISFMKICWELYNEKVDIFIMMFIYIWYCCKWLINIYC